MAQKNNESAAQAAAERLIARLGAHEWLLEETHTIREAAHAAGIQPQQLADALIVELAARGIDL